MRVLPARPTIRRPAPESSGHGGERRRAPVERTPRPTHIERRMPPRYPTRPASRGWRAGLAGAAFAATAAGAAPASGSGTGVADRYAALAPGGRLDAKRVERAFAGVVGELRGYRVLVVPSWLAGPLIAANRYGFADYFRSPLRALRAAGVAAGIADLETESTVAANGRRLAGIVAASDRPVCLVTHSKGGLDALEFLVRAGAAERRRVACWVALQAPFHGSPVADVAANETLKRLIADPVLRALGGSGGSLDDLTTGVRGAYMRRHAAAIARVLAAVPALSVATVLDDGGAALPSLHMIPPHWLLNRRGLENDGLVPLESTRLPGREAPRARGASTTPTPPPTSRSAAAWTARCS